ncbi:hypothetical protein KBY66_15335 [Synechococcus sp. Tobar12-5m-g]|uniref:hypothetical protein n=1 Tax=Synechococcus sp. Tobar12-5m-g TaxID=2823742 RepID=UPI0020CE9C1B|nr:hypothetical protein [Synechococcus sp. Tobar12-5m-g]MCP9773961.1 hypothetical protein [Synechococcus sp. Tobar12-5m-g]
MMPKPPIGRDQAESGQGRQNPDEPSSNPDAKSQNPDNNTLCKPFEDPFEDSVQNTLKSSGEAGSLCVHDEIDFAHSFEKPILLDRQKDLPYAFGGKEELKRARVNPAYEGKVIEQPDDQSLPEFIASLKAEYDDVVTLDDLVHETINKVKSNIVSDYDWKHVTEECEHHGVLFDAGDSEAVARSWWLCRIVKGFISAQDSELVRYVVERHDPDFTLRTLASSFLDFYSSQTDQLQRAGLTGEDLKIRGFYAGLELLAVGIQNAEDLAPSDSLKSGMGWEAIESVCEEILTSFAKTERGRRDALTDLALDRHDEHRNSFVWGNDDGASDAELPSPLKAKLFMKYVSQLKAAGAPMTIPAVDRDRNITAVCVTRFQGIYSNKGDVERVAALFEQRPWISTDRLSKGFRAYVGVFIKGLNGGHAFKKTRFYCTNMVSVSWFVTHLDLIVKELWGDYGDRYLRLSHPE